MDEKCIFTKMALKCSNKSLVGKIKINTDNIQKTATEKIYTAALLSRKKSARLGWKAKK